MMTKLTCIRGVGAYKTYELGDHGLRVEAYGYDVAFWHETVVNGFANI
jgi:hypothetical protein